MRAWPPTCSAVARQVCLRRVHLGRIGKDHAYESSDKRRRSHRPWRDRAPARVCRGQTTDWRQALPVLSNGVLTLRELRMSDAEALLELLTSEEVSRFISPPPTTVDGFERFIAWAQRERAAGRYICFAVVPDGMDTAIGIFQVRQLDPTFSTAEWGFAIGRAFWGSGVFVGGRAADHRLLVRDRRRPPAGGPGGRRQRPRQRRARQDRRRQGSDPAPELPARRAVLRPGALVDRARRLASRQSRVGRGGSLMAPIHRPTACVQAGIHSQATVTTSDVRKVSKGKDSNAFSISSTYVADRGTACWRLSIAFAAPVAAKPGSEQEAVVEQGEREQAQLRPAAAVREARQGNAVALGPAARHLQGDPRRSSRGRRPTPRRKSRSSAAGSAAG